MAHRKRRRKGEKDIPYTRTLSCAHMRQEKKERVTGEREKEKKQKEDEEERKRKGEGEYDGVRYRRREEDSLKER